MAEYKILSRDNIEQLHEMTHIPIKELEQKLEECENFGHKEAFWTVLGAWFSIRISGEYVRAGFIDAAVKKAIEHSVNARYKIINAEVRE